MEFGKKRIRKMKLTKNHRAALLDQLEKTQEYAELQKTCMDKQTEPEMFQTFEFSHFLAVKHVELIKKALTDNEIDY